MLSLGRVQRRVANPLRMPRRLVQLLMLCTMSLPLAACATTMGSSDPTVVDRMTLCNVWRPVTWANADTDATIEGVKVNNAKWKAFCSGV